MAKSLRRRSSGGQDAADLNSATARPHLRKRSSRGQSASDGAAAVDSSEHARDGVAAGSAKGSHAYSSNPYSRGNVAKEYSKAIKSKKRRRVVTSLLVVLLVLILGAGGTALAYLMKIQGNMNQGIDEELLSVLDTPAGGDPFYMLLMGVDGSFDRGADEMNDNTGTRSDSMILARVDPEEKKVTMVSMHRDILLNMGGNGQQKLNAAHALGGPAYAVQVVEEFAGVSISHYAEINFDAFKAMVDALGGVTVNVPMDIDDWMAGGFVPAGEQTLTGEQALILCRARHAYDDYGDGDTYRAANQRMVLGAIMEKVLASDPVTMAATLEALSKYVITDMSVTDIVGLAMQMVGMDIDKDFYTGMTPTTSALINGGWYERINQGAWNTMMDRVDQGLPPYEEDVVHETGTIMATTGSGEATAETEGQSGADGAATSQRSGTVTVKNGTSTSGLGAEAVARITPLGYTAEASNANRSDYEQTVVVYEKAGQKAAAEEIAAALGVGKVVKNEDVYVYEGDFLVLIGADWR